MRCSKYIEVKGATQNILLILNEKNANKADFFSVAGPDIWRVAVFTAAYIAPSYLFPKGGWSPLTRMPFHWAADCYSARPQYFLFCYSRGWVVFWTHSEDLPCFSRRWASLSSATLVHMNFLRVYHEHNMRARRQYHCVQVRAYRLPGAGASHSQPMQSIKRVEKAWTRSLLSLVGFGRNIASAHAQKFSACFPWASSPVWHEKVGYLPHVLC